jgi:hypothetical protein
MACRSNSNKKITIKNLPAVIVAALVATDHMALGTIVIIIIIKCDNQHSCTEFLLSLVNFAMILQWMTALRI